MAAARLQELLALLQQEEYRTAQQLARHLDVSEKTVRIRLRELHAELAGHGAGIVSKARYGYRLEVTDPVAFEIWQKEEGKGESLENARERSDYLLACLLFRPGYVKLDELCDFIYVSRPTLTSCLKMVEATLKRYHLAIERRPNYGIRVQGEEFDIRRLIIDYFIRRNCLTDFDYSHQDRELLRLAEHVKVLMARYDVHLSEISFENFVNYAYISWKRIRKGFYLKLDRENLMEIGVKEQSFIRELVHILEEENEIRYTGDEEHYLQLYLAGKRVIGSMVENDSNFVINERTDRLALEMLKMAEREYHLHFCNDFEIRMTLNQHLVPFDVRMRYGIPVKNPMVPEIKEKYSMAYQMAHVTSSVLRQYYKKEIPEEEIGYFALIFALALEKGKTGCRHDILVVCGTGKGTSRLLKYKYEQEFSDYLKNIYVCDLLGLESFDMSKVDYIFTTVPITREVTVPIIEVGMFLGTDDIQKITDILRYGNSDGMIRRYYGEKRFIRDVPAGTREEILEYLCRIVRQQEQVDENFYELVLEREAYAQMDYGNYIAIPHPNQIASEESFAYVAVLEKPVVWNDLPVQVVLLVSIGRKEDQDMQRFYETTARFALNKEAVAAVIRNPEYQVFIEMLQR